MGESRKDALLQGTLDMLILKTLSRGAMHGYSIAQFIEDSSRDVLRVEEGALYPALSRLDLQGLLDTDAISRNGSKIVRRDLLAQRSQRVLR